MLPRDLRRERNRLKKDLGIANNLIEMYSKTNQLQEETIQFQTKRLESLQARLDEIISLKMRNYERIKKYKKSNNNFYNLWMKQIAKTNIIVEREVNTRIIAGISIAINIGLLVFILNN